MVPSRFTIDLRFVRCALDSASVEREWRRRTPVATAARLTSFGGYLGIAGGWPRYRTVQRATTRASSPHRLRVLHLLLLKRHDTSRIFFCYDESHFCLKVRFCLQPIHRFEAHTLPTTHYQLPLQSQVANRQIGNKTFRVFGVFRGSHNSHNRKSQIDQSKILPRLCGLCATLATFALKSKGEAVS